MNEVILETGVGGLICRQCEDILINNLSYIKGVIKVECSYFHGRAKIIYDSDIISEDKLKKDMERIGFPATNKSGKGKIYDFISIIAIVLLFCFIHFVNLPLIPKADNGTSYPMLFLIGLVTGTHCMVMCGGIMISQTSARKIDNKKNRIPQILLYNSGRVLMASILGFIFGLIGKNIIFSMKAKSMIFTLTGVYILLVGLGIWGVPFVRRIQGGIPSLCEVKKKIHLPKFINSFVAGILTALLPCASSNSMWLIAVSAGSGIKGLLTMLFWSLGTVPFMILFGLFSSFLNGKKQALMIRINIVLLITLGLNLAIMGLSMLW